MNTPIVSVITTVHNGMPYLPVAIESIQKQTFPDWEYIIVDDGSTDDTSETLKAYSRQDPRLRIVTNAQCLGPFPSANRALGEARGRFIARLDADDEALPSRLGKQIDYLEKSP